MADNKPVGLIYNGVWSQKACAEDPRFHDLIDLVYIHDVTTATLASYAVICVPFQSNQPALAAQRDAFFDFLAQGGTLCVFGDTTPDFLPATWADRPVDNYWWKTHPDQPPITWTQTDHPLYGELAMRHACWHHHGVYTAVPESADILQRSAAGEVVSW